MKGFAKLEIQQAMEGNSLASQMTKEEASIIAVNFLKEKKKTDKVDVALVEEKPNGYLIRGTCPIDLGGHMWAEGFAVLVDLKGKIRKTEFGLL